MTGRWILWVVFCWFVLPCTSWTGEAGNPVARQSYSFFFLNPKQCLFSLAKGIGKGQCIYTWNYPILTSLLAQMGICLQWGKAGLDTWVGKISRKREWLPTLVFWLGESPWTEEPDRLQSMGSQRVGHDWATFTSLYSSQSLQQKKKRKKRKSDLTPVPGN